VKSIILAAGQGARLRPLTDDRPKCLVEYKGKALIDYILDAHRFAGISDIVIVKGCKAEKLSRPGVRTCINQQYDATNMVHTLFCAEDELHGDVIISYADIIYGSNHITRLKEAPGDFCVVIDRQWRALWEARMQDPLSDAETLRLDPMGNIIELGQKPKSYAEIQGQYVGLIKISAQAWPQIRQMYHSLDRQRLYDGKTFAQMYMTSFIQLVIDNLMPVQAVMIDGGWMEFDSISDLSLNVTI